MKGADKFISAGNGPVLTLSITSTAVLVLFRGRLNIYIVITRRYV